MGRNSPRPWHRAIASGILLFTVSLVGSLIIGPRSAPASGPLEIAVAQGSDDAEELISGWFGLSSSDLELVEENSPQIVGIRFNGLGIPAGATIDSATITFTVDEVGTAPAEIVFAAHDIGNAPTFSTSNRVSSRLRTAAAISWTPPAWTVVGASGADQQTPDLAPVLQAIVDRPDWVAGNSVVFIVTGSGTRTADSFEGKHPPVLTIHWSEVPTTTTTVTTTPPATSTTVPPATSTTTSTTAPPSTTTTSTTVPATTTTTATTVPPTTTTSTTTPATTTTTTSTTVPATTTTTTIPGGSDTFETRVSSSSDDVEELTSGWLYVNSSDLELVEESGPQTVGIRFVSVPVPRNASITSAWVQFTVDEVRPGPTTVSIRTHDTGNAPTFQGKLDVSSRPTSASSVAWAIPDWTVVGQSTSDQRTPDLAAIVQEVVNRPDWNAHQAVALVITGVGRRTAESYDASPATAPLLHVEWTVGPTFNHPPTVTATGTPTQSGGTTTLSAQVSDDGLPIPPAAVTIAWTQTSGPAPAPIANPAAATTTATLSTGGTYQFTITADDGQYQTQDTVTVIATVPTTTTTTTTTVPTNTAPTVTAGATSVLVGSLSTLEAIVGDDGLPDPPGSVTVTWQQVDGPAAAALADPGARVTTALLPAPGEYRFRVTADDGELQVFTDATATAVTTATVTRIAVIGDYGGSFARQSTLGNMVDSLNPDVVVTVGDNVYTTTGYDRNVGRYYHEYIGGYSGNYGSGSPTNRFFPTLGNHDYTDGGLGDYLAFFNLPGSGVASSNTSGNERYYDVDLGNVHLFVVNSNLQEPNGLTPTTAQGLWLQNALQASDAEWNIVSIHHPPFSSTPGKTSQWMQWPFADWGADLVLSGHAHTYERLRSGGLDYVITGLGINNTPIDFPPIVESQAIWSQNTPAALLIEACPGVLHMELHPVGYGVVDSYSIGSGSCP